MATVDSFERQLCTGAQKVFSVFLQVCYPKQTQKPLYAGLVTQCKSLGVPFIAAEELQSAPLNERCDIVLDAVFGFSFKGTPRPPFAEILQVRLSALFGNLMSDLVASVASLIRTARACSGRPTFMFVLTWLGLDVCYGKV